MSRNDYDYDCDCDKCNPEEVVVAISDTPSEEETITLTLRKGTREWAMAQHLAGKRVHLDGLWILPDSLVLRTAAASGWALYTPPPEPITVQPGSFEWAVLMDVAGKDVKRRGDARCRDPYNTNAEDRAATDWEVVE